MTHPITPSKKLIQKLCDRASLHGAHDLSRGIQIWLIQEAFQAGADKELEACVKLLELSDKNAREFLYSARRPKPPSLKEQALAELAEWERVMDIAPDSPIRRALEQLDD